MIQKILLRTVQTWDIKKKPEYRGFKCGNCQKYIHKAWHYFLKKGGYRTPVHFCNLCKTKISTLKNKGIYRTFTCDNCGGKMFKAWHVWTKKKKVLSEAHFCKKCGEKLGINKEIKGIIYDLDGTIISTKKLHEAAWLYAGRKFDIPISKRMLLSQSGISNEAAAKMMLPSNKKYLIKKFIAAKVKYVMGNLNRATLFPGILKVMEQLLQRGYSVWICTSAHKNFVKKLLNALKPLKKIIKNNVVWREMYKKEKPSPDALNLTIKKMGLIKSQVCYIGDAFSDYKTSTTTKVKFIYFCHNIKNRDLRIPKSTSVISSHKQIFNFLK
ncbi:MAG: HAD hydrolase-like protein [Patescibacteria group bacterium]|nr:HAD hydrolase-like protein [Patescibacteria group bacterium]